MWEAAELPKTRSTSLIPCMPDDQMSRFNDEEASCSGAFTRMKAEVYLQLQGQHGWQQDK